VLTYETPLVGGVTVATPFVASRRLRDGTSIGYTYDALGRLTVKDLPGSVPNPTFSYDLRGRMTASSLTGLPYHVTQPFPARIPLPPRLRSPRAAGGQLRRSIRRFGRARRPGARFGRISLLFVPARTQFGRKIAPHARSIRGRCSMSGPLRWPG